MSLFVILEDAHQSLVLLQLMKRDEASLKYDAINPYQFTIYSPIKETRNQFHSNRGNANIAGN
jgi:hypothetical protein